MKRIVVMMLCLVVFSMSMVLDVLASDQKTAPKPSHAKIMEMLKEGNRRFSSGKSIHPHITLDRLKLAAKEDQGDHAYATVITCSDSRVPVELIFDAGVMDLFVIRVAGNVSNVDQCGSIEYGLAHVNTPVLVVLGHTQCGAVKAVTHAVQGHPMNLERNIPPMVANIQQAVKRAIDLNPTVKGDAIIPYAITANVEQSIHDLFMQSPVTRNMVRNGKVTVKGALYDVGSGKIEWLPDNMPKDILKDVLKNPNRAMNAMAGSKK